MSKFLSIATKLMFFVAASIFLLAIVIILLIYKDFTFLVKSFK